MSCQGLGAASPFVRENGAVLPFTGQRVEFTACLEKRRVAQT